MATLHGSLKERRNSLGLAQKQMEKLSEEIAGSPDCPEWFIPLMQTEISRMEKFSAELGSRARRYLYILEYAAKKAGAEFPAGYFDPEEVEKELLTASK